jgi:hypothetical protein
MYPNPNFNNYLAYQMQQQSAQNFNAQPIQNLSIQPQSQCYFVKSQNDLNSVNVMPNYYYLGINADSDEIYVKRMNNDGLVEVKTYSLQSEKKEKTDFQAVFDRLDGIEKKLSELSTQRSILTLKEKGNERVAKSISE